MHEPDEQDVYATPTAFMSKVIEQRADTALAALDRIAASHEDLCAAMEGFRKRFDQRFSDISDFEVVYPDLAAALAREREGR